MGRRTVAVCLAAAVAAGGAAACSHRSGGPRPDPPAATAVGPSPALSAPPTASPSRSAAGFPSARPAGQAPTRTYAVGVRRLALNRGAGRPLPTTVWYPATGGAERASAAPGPFPLVLFSHGLNAAPNDYRMILTRWVQAGFVVAAPAYPHTTRGARDFDPVDLLNQPADASQVITDLLKRNTRTGDPLRGRIDPTRIAAAGHSGGGVTTVGLFSGSRDDRLDAGIVLAGRQLFAVPFTGPPAPMLFVHGRRDRTVEYAAGLAAFRSVPWPRALLTITAGGHVTSDRDFEVTVRTTTEFLRWSLYGDRAARARIPTEARRGGVATLTDKL